MNDSVTDGLPLAGRGRRLTATLLDAIFVPLLTLLLVMITGVVEDAEDYRDSWWMLWVLLLAILSYLILNGYGLKNRGQTLGKKIMGIAIVADAPLEDGCNAQVPAALWKLIFVRALFFPILFVGIVPPFTLLPLIDQLLIFGKRRRCLHDLLSGTAVVRLAPSQGTSD